jgi:hypothetical protein
VGSGGPSLVSSGEGREAAPSSDSTFMTDRQRQELKAAFGTIAAINDTAKKQFGIPMMQLTQEQAAQLLAERVLT